MKVFFQTPSYRLYSNLSFTDRLILLMFCINIFNLVFGLQSTCMLVSVVLLDRVMWPLEPISKGILLQLYPISLISSVRDSYLAFLVVWEASFRQTNNFGFINSTPKYTCKLLKKIEFKSVKYIEIKNYLF